MKDFIILLFIFCFGSMAIAQDPYEVIRKETDTLMRLKYPKNYEHKYVNFDILKFTIAHGRSSDHFNGYGLGLSYKLQLLWPKALFKDHFPIAWGVNIGVDKITRRHVKYFL